MKKIQGFLVMSTIIVIVVTFFSGIAFAARVTRVNKEKRCVFVDGRKIFGFIMGTEKCFFLPSGELLVDSIVQEISASESVVEKNRKLVGRERKKRIPIEKKLREALDRDIMIQKDYIKQRQEEERIKKEEEIERRKEQEQKKKQEKEQEEERIKKEDWFR